jgi:hypothetical protein
MEEELAVYGQEQLQEAMVALVAGLVMQGA